MKTLIRVEALSVIFCWLIGTAGVFAQYTTATLNGTVFDSSGAIVPDAKISIQNVETGLVRETQTGSNGIFDVTALPVGKYQLTVEKAGFAKYVQSGITLTLDESANVSVRLRVGDISQQITITADAELVNTDSGLVSQLIDQTKILDLPLDGRQPQNLLFLSSGTVNTSNT